MQFILGIAAFFFCLAVQGFAVKTVWGWYMVPLFGLPAITYANGVGLSILFDALKGFSAMTLKEIVSDDDGLADLFTAVVTNLIFTAAALGAAYFFK